MQITDLALDGVKLILPDVVHDDMGFLMEAYNPYTYMKNGISTTFIQDDHSRSIEGVVRGLHFQLNTGQVKLVRVVDGIIWNVAVDIRPDSPTFGRWVGEHLSSANYRQMLIPAGFAHGFSVLTPQADVICKTNVPYDLEDDQVIFPNDPILKIDWKVAVPIISERDKYAMTFDSYMMMRVSRMMRSN